MFNRAILNSYFRLSIPGKTTPGRLAKPGNGRRVEKQSPYKLNVQLYTAKNIKRFNEDATAKYKKARGEQIYYPSPFFVLF